MRLRAACVSAYRFQLFAPVSELGGCLHTGGEQLEDTFIDEFIRKVIHSAPPGVIQEMETYLRDRTKQSVACQKLEALQQQHSHGSSERTGRNTVQADPMSEEQFSEQSKDLFAMISALKIATAAHEAKHPIPVREDAEHQDGDAEDAGEGEPCVDGDAPEYDFSNEFQQQILDAHQSVHPTASSSSE